METLTAPTRLSVTWDGNYWAEEDPSTGVCLAIGQVPDKVAPVSPIRGQRQPSTDEVSDEA